MVYIYILRRGHRSIRLPGEKPDNDEIMFTRFICDRLFSIFFSPFSFHSFFASLFSNEDTLTAAFDFCSTKYTTTNRNRFYWIIIVASNFPKREKRKNHLFFHTRRTTTTHVIRLQNFPLHAFMTPSLWYFLFLPFSGNSPIISI